MIIKKRLWLIISTVICLAIVWMLVQQSGLVEPQTAVAPAPASGLHQDVTPLFAPANDEITNAQTQNSSVTTTSIKSSVSVKPTEISLAAWRTKSGYALYEAFAPSGESDSTYNDYQSDYLSYDAASLQALADQGDGQAALLYALQAELEPEVAIDYLEMALVDGGQMPAIYELVNQHSHLAAKASEATFDLMERLETFADKDLPPHDQETLQWLYTGVLLGDPVSLHVLNTSGLLDVLDNTRQQAWMARGQIRLNNINRARQARKLPALQATNPSQAVKEYVAKRYFGIRTSD